MLVVTECPQEPPEPPEPPVPHTFATPAPPQVAGAVQAPQELSIRGVPQLSVALTLPQFFPRREHKLASLSGVHVMPPQAASVSVGAIAMPELE